MDTIEEKLAEFRKVLLDEESGIEEILMQIKYLFEDDKDVSNAISESLYTYYVMWSCAIKLCRVKDLIDEEFDRESEE